MTGTNDHGDAAKGGRRAGDRRVANIPIDRPDRRVAERRSGEDRRANPRLNVRKS